MVEEKESSEKVENDLYFLPDVEDQNFEEEINSNPFRVNSWKDYFIAKSENGSPAELNIIGERAVKQLPGSYKLWSLYLNSLLAQCDGRCPEDPQIEAVNNAFERAFTFMHKMPVIWAMYLEFLSEQLKVDSFRKTLDRSLLALPITQHEDVWEVAIKFARKKGVPPNVGSRLYRRFTQFSPESVEERIKYLKSIHRFEEAVTLLVKVVNDEEFVSKKGKSKEKLWDELCSMMCKNPDKVANLPVEDIIKNAIKKYNFEIGKLWTSLADYYLRVLQFEKTRDVYEEGVNSVNTVRDFEYIFNTYCQFFEIMIRAKFERGETDDEDEGDFSFAGDNVDLLMARYEDLLKRRPLLVNSVLIRQNPHNVGCWLSRAKIYQRQEEPLKVIESYAMAIKTINPDKCRGNPHMLWIKLAKFYEDNSDDLDNVRKTFERAVMYPFKNVDHLATVWCTWAETEISHKNYEKALEVIKMATMLPHKKARFEEKSVGDRLVAQKRVYRSPKLWALYADLEENLGTFETTCAVYETAMELRVATVQMILNFSTFLEKKKYFEKAFQTYEKGVALFRTPHSIPIWERYISKFVARYGGTKIDRTRSIFEYAVKSFRAVEAKDILVKYANFEEKYGTPKKAMAVFDKMCDLLRGKDKYEVSQNLQKAFLVYLNKATEAFGAIMTRSIYEKAVKVLPDAFVPHICIRFANLETRLGEVDRARAVFRYSAKYADTRIYHEFWDKFEKFEADFGNIETFTDMNRIKRSVAASFTNLLVPSKEDLEKKGAVKRNAKGEEKKSNPMAEMEESLKKNPDEIELFGEVE